jgi:hypothetical protein
MMEHFEKWDSVRPDGRRERNVGKASEPISKELRSAIDETRRSIREAFAKGKSEGSDQNKVDFVLDY